MAFLPKDLRLTPARLHTLSAVGTRILASAAYLLLVLLVTHQAGAAEAANLICTVSFCYVSSMLGRIGTDQLIYSQSHQFRDKQVAAADILLTHLCTGVLLVTLFSVIAQYIAIQLGGQTGTGMEVAEVALIGGLFSITQTLASALQARGLSITSVFVFPLSLWVLLATFQLEFGHLGFLHYIIAMSVPITLAAFAIARFVPLHGGRVRRHWLWVGRHHYVMAISFYATNWMPNLYLQVLIPAGDLVAINAASRFGALQNMPASAATSYFQPSFAINAKEGRLAATENTLAWIISMNIAMQVAMVLIILPLYLYLGNSLLDDSALYILAIFLVANAVIAILGPSGPVLSMMGNQATLAKVSFFIMACSIPIGAVAAIQFDAIGFAVAASAATVLQSVVYAVILRRRWGISGLGRIAIAIRSRKAAAL